jgi:hypothetical protein
MTNPDHARLEAAARRALDVLGHFILDSPDPGAEALGAQYELRQLLLGAAPEIPTVRVWQIEARRASGAWTPWSGATVDGPDAHADYAETVAEYGHLRPYRVVCATTTHGIEAQHQPEPDDGAPAVSPAV